MLRQVFPALILLLTGTMAFGQMAAINTEWLPITDADRASKPAVDPQAGVEALLWREHVVDEVVGGEDLQRVIYHYVRLKVFDEKGKERVATIDIPSGNKTAVEYVAGRTVKADGTVIPLAKDAVYTREVVRVGGMRRRVKSFAMPGVEPGSIVEYRWKEIRFDPRWLYLRLDIQQPFPVQKLTLFVKPLSQKWTTNRMQLLPFNCVQTEWKEENDGFNSMTFVNIPAFEEEPYMPSEPNVRGWVLIRYTDGKKQDPEKYWHDVGKRWYGDLKAASRANGDVKDAAATAAAGANTAEDKVAALVTYVRKNLRDIDDPSVTLSERAKFIAKLPKSRLRTAGEVLSSGIGTAYELNLLVAAMASSLDLETRPALLSDREDVIFIREMTDSYFLENVDLALKVEGGWKLFDVTAKRLSPHMLPWQQEGMQVLLSDPKEPVFIQSPVSEPEASVARRTARLHLSEEGGIDGEIEESYTGHMAADQRADLMGESADRLKELVKQRVLKTYPQAEVTEIRVEHVDDTASPVSVRYRFKVDGYAQKTGKRLFVQPLLFERGAAPRFSASKRKHGIVFRYPWKEVDDVTIELPNGYALDHPEKPGDINMGRAGAYTVKMSIAGRELRCSRELAFGRGGGVGVDQRFYPQLKAVFDMVQQHDQQAMSIKAAAAPAPAGAQ